MVFFFVDYEYRQLLLLLLLLLLLCYCYCYCCCCCYCVILVVIVLFLFLLLLLSSSPFLVQISGLTGICLFSFEMKLISHLKHNRYKTNTTPPHRHPLRAGFSVSQTFFRGVSGTVQVFRNHHVDIEFTSTIQPDPGMIFWYLDRTCFMVSSSNKQIESSSKAMKWR